VDYSDKPNSVYSQHERHFATKKDGRDPRQAFFEDLDHDMLVWLASGDLIVLGLDANEHVRQGTTVEFINKWGLVDVHADRHSHLPPVATQDTNQNSVPVNGLWCSPGLPITAAGMTGFGEIKINNADHRMLWVDLPNAFLFGFCPPSLPTITPNRLNLRNPKVIARYNKIQKKEKRRHLVRVPEKIQHVLTPAQQGLFNEQDAALYESAARQDTLARRHAQAKCRPIYMGQVAFSDVLNLASDEIH
jgi:hypothetical protein